MKRIVIKFGTGILTRPDVPGLDFQQIGRLSAEIAALVKDGAECILVSSGAIAAGLSTFGLEERPQELALIQACAAVGQSKLMQMFEDGFALQELSVAQLLLTHDDLHSEKRRGNVKKTLEELLRHRHIVPILNENDSVAVEEIRFGDNDQLSAAVAKVLNADLLLLMTSADGLLDGEKLVTEVHKIDEVLQLALPTKGRLSMGGMSSKLLAVKDAVTHGITTVIANGRTPGAIVENGRGNRVGTRFYPQC